MSYLQKTDTLTLVTCTMKNDLQIDFCVVGAQKAASSYLQFAIDEHPDINAPRGETTFFEDDEYHKIDSRKNTLVRGLIKQPNKQIIGTKRPTYLTNPLVPQRLYDHNPKIKIIAILRDPVKRFFSAYHHLVKSGYLKPITIDKFLDECMQDSNFIHKNMRIKSLFEYGLYAGGLQNYFRIFPTENVKVVLTEDLMQNRDQFFVDVYNFLGVKSYAPKISKNARPMKSVSNQYRLQIWNYLNLKLCTFSDDKMRGYGPANLAARILLKAAKILDDTILSKLLLDRSNVLQLRHEYFLRQYYIKDIQKLEKILNIDLKPEMNVN